MPADGFKRMKHTRFRSLKFNGVKPSSFKINAARFVLRDWLAENDGTQSSVENIS